MLASLVTCLGPHLTEVTTILLHHHHSSSELSSLVSAPAPDLTPTGGSSSTPTTPSGPPPPPSTPTPSAWALSRAPVRLEPPPELQAMCAGATTSWCIQQLLALDWALHCRAQVRAGGRGHRYGWAGGGTGTGGRAGAQGGAKRAQIGD